MPSLERRIRAGRTPETARVRHSGQRPSPARRLVQCPNGIFQLHCRLLIANVTTPLGPAFSDLDWSSDVAILHRRERMILTIHLDESSFGIPPHHDAGDGLTGEYQRAQHPKDLCAPAGFTCS